MKKVRIIPDKYIDKNITKEYNVFADFTIKKHIGWVYHKSGSKGPVYSDAELRLMVAQLEVAKEEFSQRCDEVAEMLREIINQD